ncbi:alkaline-phosphatase-like protein [Paraphysoderma sedebokerense]|nr:alkaline-phosphatase-like protein [Paraphysoderma sedebokerense]
MSFLASLIIHCLLLHISKSSVTQTHSFRLRLNRRYKILLIILALALLLITLRSLSKYHSTPSFWNGTIILISIDGFRTEYLERGLTPTLELLAETGVSADYLEPTFPTSTFPNHYSLVTGFYPSVHGIVANTFFDPELNGTFVYTDRRSSGQGKWWVGRGDVKVEPIWVTADKSDIVTAAYMYPGTEAMILGSQPTYVVDFDHTKDLQHLSRNIMDWVKLPDVNKPQLIIAYIGVVDTIGHKFGPNSLKINETITQVDTLLSQLYHQTRDLDVNFMIVGDHGMTSSPRTKVIYIDDIIDLSKSSVIDHWPNLMLIPFNDDDINTIYSNLTILANTTEYQDSFTPYLRSNIPPNLHFGNNPRISPIYLIPSSGYLFSCKNQTENLPLGMHGYPRLNDMTSIFILHGSLFSSGARIGGLMNTEIYEFLCRLLGIGDWSGTDRKERSSGTDLKRTLTNSTEDAQRMLNKIVNWERVM